MTEHPPYYGGADDPYEAIKVIQAWGLNFSLGSVVKYVRRAGKKEGEADLKDLKKARDYIDFEIAERERKAAEAAKVEEPKDKLFDPLVETYWKDRIERAKLPDYGKGGLIPNTYRWGAPSWNPGQIICSVPPGENID